MKTRIHFTLNGSPVSAEVANDRTLLKFLREDLGITSLKNSCNVGECGACTILLDGEAVRACLILAVMVDGKRVETLEALGNPLRPHPIQRAFLEAGAVQCGFCAPGMIIPILPGRKRGWRCPATSAAAPATKKSWTRCF